MGAKSAKRIDKEALSEIIFSTYTVRIMTFSDIFYRYFIVKLRKKVRWIYFYPLLTLIVNGDQTPTQLSKRILRSNISMSAVYNDLERRGYIKRYPDENDHRKVAMKITSSGQDYVRETLIYIDKVEQEITGVMNSEDLQEMAKLIRELRRLITEVIVTDTDLKF